MAESVLPHVENLSKSSSIAEVVLITVTKRVKGYRLVAEHFEDHVEEHAVPEGVGWKEEQAQRYLDGVAEPLHSKGIQVKTQVLAGDPAEEITAYSEVGGCDLIVMASHGRSGPTRWALGSVADKVFRASCIPVLMVRGPGQVLSAN